MENNKSCLLALNRINGVGPVLCSKFLAQWPNLIDMFAMSPNDLMEYGLREHIAMAISNFNFAIIQDDLEWEARDSANKIISFGEPNYPRLLSQIPDPPPILYVCGNISYLESLTVAIVGSRKPSIAGFENAFKFSYDLAKCNMTVVSGLALGVDAQAHKAAISAGGKTIAVMGTGIDNTYPRTHKELARKICENGLLISEFPLKTLPRSGHFPRRNRIISGLALATLVVEATEMSGSLITARFALEQNRDVFAIPGSIHNQQSKGCHYLLRQGAKLVTSYVDVLEELNIEIRTFVESTSDKNYNNQGIIKYIGFEVTTIDQLIVRSGKTVDSVICDVTKLELDGLISAVPGGYMRCR
jgi:DNA processing protein